MYPAKMDIKNLVIALALTVLIGITLRYKRKIILPFSFALLISLLWTFYYRYEYIGHNLFLLGRINLYPLVLWTAGLTLLYIAYVSALKKYNPIIAIALYLVALGSLEAIGYYLLNIRLDSNFTSLLNFGVIHAPLEVKIFYIIAGPAYIFTVHNLSKRHNLLPKYLL